MKYLILLISLFVFPTNLIAQKAKASFYTNYDNRMGHLGFVAFFAPDAQSIYTYKPVNYFGNPSAKVWGLDGKLKHTIDKAITFAISDDHQWQASYEVTKLDNGKFKYIIKIWKSFSSEPHKEIILEKRLKYFKLSPDGQYLFTNHDDKILHVYKVNKGKLVKSIKVDDFVKIRNSHDKFFPLFFHPDGDKVLLANSRGGLDWINFLTEEKTPCIPANNFFRVNSGAFVSFNKNLQQIGILYNNYDNESLNFRTWSLSGELVKDQKILSKNIREKFAITPDFKYLLMIGRSQKKVLIVDLSSGKTKGVFTPHPDYEKYSKEIKPKISTIDISSDGKHLLSIAGDGAVKVWDMTEILKLENAPANNSIDIQRNNNTTNNTSTPNDNSNLDLDFDLEDLRSEGEYHALIIAAENYIDKEINDLSNPSKDAKALTTVLQSSYLFKEENTTQLINPTRGDIIQAFDNLSRKLGPLDNLLIFLCRPWVLG